MAWEGVSLGCCDIAVSRSTVLFSSAGPNPLIAVSRATVLERRAWPSFHTPNAHIHKDKVCTVNENLFLMTTHPSPLFLCSTRPGAVTRVLEALRGSLDTREAFDFTGNNDTFRFHPPEDAASVLQLPPSDVKHVIAYAGEELPARHLTTHFNFEQYFRYLAEVRTPTDDGSWRFGEVILYGEVVTSTQTMFDK